MKRHWNICQENLHQQYVEIGTEITKQLSNNNSFGSNYTKGWELITFAGFWKLFNFNQSLNTSFESQIGIIAFRGLSSGCRNKDFLLSVIDQLSVIYLISRFGSEKNKEKYIPELMKGKYGAIYSIDAFDSFSKSNFDFEKDYSFKLIKNESSINNIIKNKVIIFANVFLISKNMDSFLLLDGEIDQIYIEKIYCQIRENTKGAELLKLINSLQISHGNYFFSLRQGNAAFFDLINFKRLLFTILVTTFSLSIEDKYRRIIENFKAFKLDEKAVKKSR